MRTGREMRMQQRLIRADGKREGMIQGAKQATDEVIAYLASQAPPAKTLALQFIADIRAGKAKPVPKVTAIPATATVDMPVDIEVTAEPVDAVPVEATPAAVSG